MSVCLRARDRTNGGLHTNTTHNHVSILSTAFRVALSLSLSRSLIDVRFMSSNALARLPHYDRTVAHAS